MPNDTGFGKIAIGLRYSRQCTAFMESWTRLVMNGLRPGDVVLPIVGDLPHHFAAETIVWHFLQTDCDSLLMVDDDHIFEPAHLHRLRDNVVNHPFAVVGGLYPTRRPQYKPVMLSYDKQTGDYHSVKLETPRTTQPCNIVGLGFTLIRKSIVEAIHAKYPGELYFAWMPDGDGEDAFFCHRVEKCGGTIGVDTTVCVWHTISATVRVKEDAQEVAMEGTVDGAFCRRLSELKAEKKALEQQEKAQ